MAQSYASVYRQAVREATRIEEAKAAHYRDTRTVQERAAITAGELCVYEALWTAGEWTGVQCAGRCPRHKKGK